MDKLMLNKTIILQTGLFFLDLKELLILLQVVIRGITSMARVNYYLLVN